LTRDWPRGSTKQSGVALRLPPHSKKYDLRWTLIALSFGGTRLSVTKLDESSRSADFGKKDLQPKVDVRAFHDEL
jgi:hypothetical protein